MLRPLAMATVLALAALLAACPESVNPLSDPARAAPDPALFGVWHGSFDGDEMYLHAGPGERGMTRVVQVEHKKKGAIETAQYAAFPARVGKQGYLTVRRTDDEADFRGYWLFRYELKHDRLTLWMLSLKAAQEDIRAGKLAGRTGEGPYGETLITASSEALVQYLAQGEEKRLFDHPLAFQRVTRR